MKAYLAIQNLSLLITVSTKDLIKQKVYSVRHGRLTPTYLKCWSDKITKRCSKFLRKNFNLNIRKQNLQKGCFIKKWFKDKKITTSKMKSLDKKSGIKKVCFRKFNQKRDSNLGKPVRTQLRICLGTQRSSIIQLKNFRHVNCI